MPLSPRAGQFQIPRYIIDIRGLVALEVGARGDIAVGVVGGGLRGTPAAGGARLADAGVLHHAQDGLEAVGASGTEGVRDCRCVCARVAECDPLYAARVFGADRPASDIVFIRGKPRAVLIEDAG